MKMGKNGSDRIRGLWGVPKYFADDTFAIGKRSSLLGHSHGAVEGAVPHLDVVMASAQ